MPFCVSSYPPVCQKQTHLKRLWGKNTSTANVQEMLASGFSIRNSTGKVDFYIQKLITACNFDCKIFKHETLYEKNVK